MKRMMMCALLCMAAAGCVSTTGEWLPELKSTAPLVFRHNGMEAARGTLRDVMLLNQWQIADESARVINCAERRLLNDEYLQGVGAGAVGRLQFMLDDSTVTMRGNVWQAGVAQNVNQGHPLVRKYRQQLLAAGFREL